MRVVALVLMVGGLATGCMGTIPADVDDTLEHARGGTLQVGVSEATPWTEVADDGTVGGTEAELVERYAASIDAEIEWVPAPESVLAARLRDGGLDLAVGGLTEDSPWTSDMALTRPYTTAPGADGRRRGHVITVRPGENALLVDLELFLARDAGELR